jgi:hypothetical protein
MWQPSFCTSPDYAAVKLAEDSLDGVGSVGPQPSCAVDQELERRLIGWLVVLWCRTQLPETWYLFYAVEGCIFAFQHPFGPHARGGRDAGQVVAGVVDAAADDVYDHVVSVGVV